METSSKPIHIVGICGSLRKNSINRGLLRSFEKQLPQPHTFTMANISNLPFFNEDIEQPLPESVVALKQVFETADAFVISTPEYNLSITGVLKNALEWFSRQSVGRPLAGKPVMIMGASPLALGTSQAQAHLRDIVFGLNMRLVNRPILMIGNSRGKFDEEGNLIDTAAEQLISQAMSELLK